MGESKHEEYLAGLKRFSEKHDCCPHCHGTIRKPASTDLAEELLTVKDQVEYLLESYPETRNSDFYLIILWLRYYGGFAQLLPHIPFALINKISGRLETVTRLRRKFQEGNRYLPTDPTVQARRRKRAEEFRQTMPRLAP